MPAAHAVIRTLGAQVGYEEMLVLTGSAFSFVYDNAPVYEPGRDLHPLDTVMLAMQSAGYSGRWLADRPSADVLGAVDAALSDGRPPLLSLYDDDLEQHGFYAVTDCAPADRRVTVQQEQPAELTLPETWWGAVPGPRAWAACPVFVPERSAAAGWSAEGRLHRALHRGTALLIGGRVAYRDCDGSRVYTGVPLAGRQAAFGLPAYDLLSADVGGAENLGDFSLLWRLDAQVSQLRHGRSAAAAHFRTIAHRLAQSAEEAATAAARAADELCSRFWFRPTRSMATAADVLAASATQGAMVFWVGLEGEELARLARRVAVVRTPWGPIAVIDTIPRRREAAALVRQLAEQDRLLLRLLGELRDAL